MTGADLDYLARAFGRIHDRALLEAQTAHQRVMAKANLAGAIGGSRHLLLLRSERETALKTAATEMARLAYEATGATSSPVSDLLAQHLARLQAALTDQLRAISKPGRPLSMDVTPLLEGFEKNAEAAIAEVVDDYRLGIIGGVRPVRDPVVTNITATISNSPGAVVQAGTDNVQHNISTRPAEIRAALSEFLEAEEVLALSPEQRQGLIDVTDVIEGELAKPEPDAAKLARWGTRLQGVAENLGVAVAAETLLRLIFGA